MTAPAIPLRLYVQWEQARKIREAAEQARAAKRGYAAALNRAVEAHKQHTKRGAP